MYYAILNNKVPFFDEPKNEDSLTSTFFGLLFHLSDESISEFFEKIIGKAPGRLIDFEFWPKWNPAGTENKRYVEPDLIIKFEDYDIIVEVKKTDPKKKISNSQIAKEVQAYKNEYGNKEAFYLGIANNDNKENYQGIKLFFYTWHQIATILFQATENREITKKDKWIFNELQGLLPLYGVAYSVPDWSKLETEKIEFSIDDLKKLSDKFLYHSIFNSWRLTESIDFNKLQILQKWRIK